MLDKEKQAAFRIKFKQATHQKHPLEAFKLAIMASDAMRDAGMSGGDALVEVGRWLCAHAKGPSRMEWSELATKHRELLANTAMEPEGQMEVFQFTHFLVLAVNNWRRHLKSIPQLIDVVLGTTLPVLGQADAVPVSMKLVLMQQVEEVLARQKPTRVQKLRLAELRMMRGKLLLGAEDEATQQEGRDLLTKQAQVFQQLTKQGVKQAEALREKALSWI